MTTVIIPTLNAEQQIERLLVSLKGQSVPCEVIVIDSSEGGPTPEIAQSLGAVVVPVRREKFDHGGTRNLALQHAAGELVVFMTQDALPADDRAIERLIAPFQERLVAAVYGRQIPQPGAGPFAAHLRFFNYRGESFVRTFRDRERFGIKTPFLSNAFAAYRKDALLSVGGFRNRLILGEDTVAGAHLLAKGYALAYAADAVVFHSHSYTVGQEFRRYFDIGVFHREEDWILEEFGKAEGEGMRYLRSELAYLRKEGKTSLVPEMAVRTVMKYAGYRLGKSHRVLPRGLVKRLSMHKGWWERGS